MNLENIYKNFDSSVNWNAYLYFFQKAITSILTIIFFKKLSSTDFSILANVNSIIFLILLWVDFGFRKSIPKYIPEFSKNKNSHLGFTKFIIKFQTIALIASTIFLFFYLRYIANFIGIKISSEVEMLAIAIFMIEAPIALLKLIYHAHFWNKYFNFLYSVIILVEALIYLFILFFAESINISNIFLIKIISGILILIISSVCLIKLYLKKEYLNNDSYDNDFQKTNKEFLKHSFIMWCNSSARSLSERNFLIPVLTFSLGPQIANIFKISNDWALLFQRAILKAIGTTDTSLFSHVQMFQKSCIQDAFTKIIAKIMRLCIPLFGIFIFLVLNKDYFMGQNHMIFQTFIILVFLYIIESVLSPYERLLEVNKNYFVLILSYLPYLLFIYLLVGQNLLSLIGFEMFIISLCVIKLISSIGLAIYSKRKYKIRINLKDLF